MSFGDANYMTKPNSTAQRLKDLARPEWANKLRHYQWDGAQWLSQPPFPMRGRLLNDDRGFGKTFQGLAAARLRQDLGLSDNKCVLVLTTATARFDWRRDAQKLWPEAKVALIGEKSFTKRKGDKRKGTAPETDEEFAKRSQPWRELLRGDVPAIVACSFSTESMEKLLDFALENDVVFDTIIIDEAHYLKKAENETSKVARMLVGRCRVVFLLTATAVHNRAMDLHNLLDLVAPGTYGSKYRFAERYFAVRVANKGFGRTVDELLDFPGLKRDIAPACLKRSIAEAYGELPAVIRELRRIDCGNTYRISRESARKLKDGGAMDAELRRCAGVKLKAVAEFIEDLDEPVVAYTYERKHASELAAMLEKKGVKVTLATGDVTSTKRDSLIEGWKAGNSRVLVCTMDAVKESATLTRASAMVFLDIDWLPGKQLQCEGRIDPARQPENERRPARYYYFVTHGGPDEVVAERVIAKIQEAAGLIGDDSALLGLAGTLKPMARELKTVSTVDMLADLVARVEARAERFESLGFDVDDFEM